VRVLLDTHALVYAFSQPELLSPKVRRLLQDPEIERWVSVVSLWEMAIKVQIGKLSLPLDTAYYYRNLEALGARTLGVTVEHSLALLRLPLHHRDPFDRLLIAQATEENLTLVSRDKAFRAYDVARVW
jgi:PIN domain nuclease of toxin-antitoxin system